MRKFLLTGIFHTLQNWVRRTAIKNWGLESGLEGRGGGSELQKLKLFEGQLVKKLVPGGGELAIKKIR